MANGERVTEFSTRESAREREFGRVWTEELNDAFADIAGYYDRANHVASLGLWSCFRSRFLATMDLRSGQKVLDICAGTNAVGIALLRAQSDLEVYAMDRSADMQKVGRRTAERQGLRVESVVADVHALPYPDDQFDVVTVQWASRHLRIVDVCVEVKRVLKPGGHFYHCDMLRPTNRFVERVYYGYLRGCLAATAWVFGSGPAARSLKMYFIHALSMFYSADELTRLLEELGFEDVSSKTLLGGMLGFHKAAKPGAGEGG